MGLKTVNRYRRINMGYFIVAVIIAAFIGGVFVVAKKDAKERDEMVSKLTEEQKNMLMIFVYFQKY